MRKLLAAFRSRWSRPKPDKYSPPKGRRGFKFVSFEDGVAHYTRYGLGGLQNCQLEWSNDAQRWVLQGYQNLEDFSGIRR
ncbi:hypothetical protein LCGC14_1664400 [marine sediment metagenome]|uniref:Uncharacterized protein n=1 Tax=marine sediment metagenome TaxID=412755 RepID=A0A0F9KT48_9ZZZZ